MQGNDMEQERIRLVYTSSMEELESELVVP